MNRPTQTMTAAGLGALLFLTAAPAWGADAIFGDRFSSVSFGTSSGIDLRRRDDRETTAYVGIEECESAYRNDATFFVEYTTEANSPFAIDDSGMFTGRLFFFQNDTTATNTPDCQNEEGGCSPFSLDTDAATDQNNLRYEISWRELLEGEGVERCSEDRADEDFVVRFQIDENIEENPRFSRADLRIRLDTRRPPPPASLTAVATEEVLAVEHQDAEDAGDTDEHLVLWASEPFAPGLIPQEAIQALGISRSDNTRTYGGDSDEIDTNFAAGTTLYIGLAAVDEAGNESALIGPEEVIVIDTQDAWEYGLANGSEERGGYCAAAPGGRPGPGALGLALLAGVIGWRRSRERTKSEVRS